MTDLLPAEQLRRAADYRAAASLLGIDFRQV